MSVGIEPGGSSDNDDVRLAAFTWSNADRTELSRGHGVFEYETDPALIAATTGSATFSGNTSYMVYKDGTFAFAGALGSAEFTVPFDGSNTITGTLTHGAATGIATAQAFELVDGRISGSQFTASLTPTLPTADGQV